MSRKLLKFALTEAGGDESNVSLDTGWLRLDKTVARSPTIHELAELKRKLGNVGILGMPQHWAHYDNKSQVHLHVLRERDSERLEVENAFLATLRRPYFDMEVEIVGVERVQNLPLLQAYMVKRQSIFDREAHNLPSSLEEEEKQRILDRMEKKWLFHGTCKEVMQKIIAQGFNRSFCGRHATAFGRGVYFARDASYSAKRKYAKPDNDGVRRVIVSQVVVGEYCRGRVSSLNRHLPASEGQFLIHTIYFSFPVSA